MTSIQNHPQGIKPPSSTTSRINKVTFHDEVAFDDGKRAIIHRLIDTGDFRSVYMARDVNTSQLYALKKISCIDEEQAEQCRKEVAIHHLLHHDNIMPILGHKFFQQEDAAMALHSDDARTIMVCFMRFPFLPHSLGDDINARRLLEDTLESKRRPYSQREALALFAGIVSGVNAMHGAGFSHRDIRVENVLLQKKEGRQRRKRHAIGIPILTDLGSVGPLTAAARLTVHDVERNTTLCYRAPELFPERILSSLGPSELLHFDYADIWSLGCLLFAILYGATPFEIEWGISFVEGSEAEGTARWVGNVTLEKILDPVPFPPCGTAADRRYNGDINDLIRFMLNTKEQDRPSTSDVLEKIGNLLG